MSISSKAFGWLSTLENEFDKGLVEFELSINNLNDFEEEEIDQFRNKINSLASLFAQLVHKAQTIFESNAKLEAMNLSLKKDLEESLTRNSLYRSEIDDLIKQIHCMQLKNYSLSTSDEDSDLIIEKLCKDMEEKMKHHMGNSKLEAYAKILEKENQDFKDYILALQSELYGARLASKYLDKELAGRIQQIQLLSRKMDGEKYDQMWSTLESEINIQRQKTVVKAVKGPNSSHDINSEPLPEFYNTVRTVRLLRSPTESLGMSVTGGQEHGIPLLISELYPGQPAALCGKLYVGDCILGVNGQSIRGLSHHQAVSLLSKAKDEVILEVMFISHNDHDDNLEDDKIHVTDDGYMYRLYRHPKVPFAKKQVNVSKNVNNNNLQETSSSDNSSNSDRTQQYTDNSDNISASTTPTTSQTVALTNPS